jgi:hypothetical protein
MAAAEVNSPTLESIQGLILANAEEFRQRLDRIEATLRELRPNSGLPSQEYQLQIPAAPPFEHIPSPTSIASSAHSRASTSSGADISRMSLNSTMEAGTSGSSMGEAESSGKSELTHNTNRIFTQVSAALSHTSTRMGYAHMLRQPSASGSQDSLPMPPT